MTKNILITAALLFTAALTFAGPSYMTLEDGSTKQEKFIEVSDSKQSAVILQTEVKSEKNTLFSD